MATGQLADALDRDLRRDRLDFDSLGWRGLWCYITQATPETAVYLCQNENWKFEHHLQAEMLYEFRKLNWRYAAINFKNGSKLPFPEPIARPGVEPPVKTEFTASDWESVTDIEELIPPEIRELLRE